MRTIILGVILLVSSACSWGADASGRVDTRVLSGETINVKDRFTRMTIPVFVNTSLLYIATNNSDGVILINTNATVLVVIGLPNPTNNIGRRFEVVTMGAATARLTNTTVAGTFVDMFTQSNSAVGLFMQSNKVATCFSTGTNWYCHIQ